MTSTPRILATLLAATAVALTSACADSTAGRAGGTPPRIDLNALPPGQIVWQVGSDGGGYTPSDYRAATEPELTIYANGDVYESKSPGLTNTAGQPWTFRVGHIGLGRLARLLAGADASGLFHQADFGVPAITDVGGTSVRLQSGTAPARTIDVYALFYSEGDGNLTDTQRANRAALRKLVGRFDRAVEHLNTAPWRPTRVAVIQRYVTGATDPVGSPDPTSGRAWPGPAPATLLTHKTYDGKCGVVRGVAAKLLYAAAVAHRSTRWTYHGQDVYLLVRAVLPGEPGCPN